MSGQVPKPTVGRIVHYRSPHKDQPYPAVITHVWSDDCVNLSVFQDGSHPLRATTEPTSVTRGDGDYQWQWMPYQLKKQHGSESGEKSQGTEEI